MADQLGERLTDLSRGDSVAVRIEGAEYDGAVIEVNRTMCELEQGFMQSGAISVGVELTPETVGRYELSREFVLISATETAPRSWEVPEASFCEPVEGKTGMELGAVTELEIGSGSR